jgi:hypothetical protein
VVHRDERRRVPVERVLEPGAALLVEAPGRGAGQQRVAHEDAQVPAGHGVLDETVARRDARVVGERLAQGVAVVVVAGDGVHGHGERREQLADACVGARVAVVHEVAGEEDGAGLRVQRGERGDGHAQRLGGAAIVGTDRQVQVGELRDQAYATGARSRSRSMAGS